MLALVAQEKSPAAVFVTINVTGTVWGLFEEPLAVIVIVPLWVPTLSPEIFTDTLITSVSPVEEPTDGLKDSQSWLSLAAQFRVPPPQFQRFKPSNNELGPPSVAIKSIRGGSRQIAGATAGAVVNT